METVRMLLVAQVNIEDGHGSRELRAQAKLDDFRESVLPSQEHGITLYRATSGDVADFLDSPVQLPVLKGGVP